MTWDGEVVLEETASLTGGQIFRLLRMMETLRDMGNLEQVLEIKKAIKETDYIYARAMWDDFEDWEQEALWVAPLFGGIFTTRERELLRPDGENQ